MQAQELKDAVRRKPFQPFRLVMTDGKAFAIDHPDQCAVYPNVALITILGEDGLGAQAVAADLVHIIRLESDEPVAPPPDGLQPA
jgi:hypothetical protein